VKKEVVSMCYKTIQFRSYKLIILLILGVLLSSCGGAQAINYALVIGNSDYNTVKPLKNPVNDAELMTESLQNSNFQITKITNIEKLTFKGHVDDFLKKLPLTQV
jgi:hypothetical protein